MWFSRDGTKSRPWHSNLQTKFGVGITSNIFKIIQFKNHGIAYINPPDLPTLKAYPIPGVGGRFEIFSLKWKERMNLKVPGAILPLGCAILSTRAKTIGGLLQPPLGELVLNQKIWCCRKISCRILRTPSLYNTMPKNEETPSKCYELWLIFMKKMCSNLLSNSNHLFKMTHGYIEVQSNKIAIQKR